MKSGRNDSCPCGSGKKFKACCDKKGSVISSENGIIHWLISFAVGVFLIFLIWGMIEHFTASRPEMEAYKCDNPNCGKIHYRPINETN